MGTSKRIQVTLSQPMQLALGILSERSGLPYASQALAVLRAGLDRTIHSAECQDRLRRAGAYRTRDQWLDDRANDVRAETSFQIAGDADALES